MAGAFAFMASFPRVLHALRGEFTREDDTHMRHMSQRNGLNGAVGYKTVMDDARFRAYGTMADSREWCERCLPGWDMPGFEYRQTD
jgi:hypothetical protein